MRYDLLFLVLHGVILNTEHNQAQTQNLANLPILELQCSQPQITKHNINPVRDLWRENSFFQLVLDEHIRTYLLTADKLIAAGET